MRDVKRGCRRGSHSHHPTFGKESPCAPPAHAGPCSLASSCSPRSRSPRRRVRTPSPMECGRRRGTAVAGQRRTPRRGPGRRLGRAPGDGSRRRLRRGQRDRRWPRAVRLLARGRAVVLAGGRRRGRRAPRAAQRRAQRRCRVRPRAHRADRGRVRRHARRDPARTCAGGRHRHGRDRRDQHDRGAGRRQPLPRRAVHVPGRDPARRMAADERRQRPRRLAEGRQAVRAPRSRPVPRTEPHALHTKAYAADFNEVKDDRLARPAEPDIDQTVAAQYWGQGNATATMASVLRSVADTQGGTWPTTRGCSRAPTRTPPMRRSSRGVTRRATCSGGRSPRSARPRATATPQPRPTRHGRR